MKLLLFDIDGTLLLAGSAPKMAMEAAFESLFAIPGAWADTVAHGNTDPLIIEYIAQNALGRSLSHDEYAQFCSLYFDRLHTELQSANSFRIMPGVPALCAQLSASPEILLGLETGNFEKSALLKLQRANLDHHFPIGGYASDSAERSEIIEKAVERARTLCDDEIVCHDIYIVGDAPQDVYAGKSLGYNTIAVATGKSSYEELLETGASHVLRDLSDSFLFLQLIGLE